MYYITKEQIVKQFDELIEQLDTINALGIARAAQNYAEETEENIEAMDRILSKSKYIAKLQRNIENTKQQMIKNTDSKNKGFRVMKYKVEQYRLDALELLEEILELDADIDLDNTELDPIDIFGDDNEGEE